ncbi:hypothetical protein PENSUB_10631 [Penicillium subrubescens]|uniref:Uncharacterized protein n=1 Tax=Penicillium subrubescens TaxID=1316194 RepID=A0A1Q5T899_9EURO|nr:hypothetical protein PENSUB_10631 [Penicillium subrubescens]
MPVSEIAGTPVRQMTAAVFEAQPSSPAHHLALHMRVDTRLWAAPYFPIN